MENTNTVNNVNVSLSDYNRLKSDLEASRDLLTKTTTELNILRNKQTEDKLIILERKVYEPNYGQKTVQKLELNIKDPQTSKVILDAMSQIESSELETKIKEKEQELKSLKSNYEELGLELEVVNREFRRQERLMEDSNKEQIRKLKKGYEETILDLEIDKETLQKSLKDLKVNKTQEQLELAHVQEVSELKDKLAAVSDFKDQLMKFESNPFKLRNFIKLYKAARAFREERSWINNLWTNVQSATERIEAYTKLIKNVGRIDKKTEVTPMKEPQYYSNGYGSYIAVPQPWNGRF